MNSDDKKNLKMACSSWLHAKQEVLEKNRFFPQNMDKFYELINLLCQSEMLFVKPNTIFYRARVIRDDIELDGNAPFYGYNKEGSFIPPKGISSPGRANPRNIRYLYVASDAITAAMECRARLEDTISVAEIQSNDLLKIADLVYFKEINTIDEMFRFLLSREFSAPVKDESDYIFSQFLSEYIKSLGYDGVRYNSAQNKSGANFTIFSYDKCEAIASSVYEVKSICMSIKPIKPVKGVQIKNHTSTLSKEGKASFTPKVYKT